MCALSASCWVRPAYSSPYSAQPAGGDSRREPPEDLAEQPGRQKSVLEALGLSGRHRAKIGAGPDAKGVGESGTVASTPTVMNAILDALAPLGVTDVPMPATPERIWRAMMNAQRADAART